MAIRLSDIPVSENPVRLDSIQDDNGISPQVYIDPEVMAKKTTSYILGQELGIDPNTINSTYSNVVKNVYGEPLKPSAVQKRMEEDGLLANPQASKEEEIIAHAVLTGTDPPQDMMNKRHQRELVKQTAGIFSRLRQDEEKLFTGPTLFAESILSKPDKPDTIYAMPEYKDTDLLDIDTYKSLLEQAPSKQQVDELKSLRKALIAKLNYQVVQEQNDYYTEQEMAKFTTGSKTTDVTLSAARGLWSALNTISRGTWATSVAMGAVWNQPNVDQVDEALKKTDLTPIAAAGKIGYVVSAMSEAIPSFIYNMSVGNSGIFVVEFGNAYQDALNNGASVTQAKVIATPVATINTIIESMQIEKIYKFAGLGKGAKGAIKKMVQDGAYKAFIKSGAKFTGESIKTAVNEGMEGALQQGVSIAVPAFVMGTYPKDEKGNIDWANIGSQIGQSFVGEGLGGLFLGGAGGIYNARQVQGYKNTLAGHLIVDEGLTENQSLDIATKIVERLKNNDGNPKEIYREELGKVKMADNRHKAVAHILKKGKEIGDTQYRQIATDTTGKESMTDMNYDEAERFIIALQEAKVEKVEGEAKEPEGDLNVEIVALRDETPPQTPTKPSTIEPVAKSTENAGVAGAIDTAFKNKDVESLRKIQETLDPASKEYDRIEEIAYILDYQKGNLPKEELAFIADMEKLATPPSAEQATQETGKQGEAATELWRRRDKAAEALQTAKENEIDSGSTPENIKQKEAAQKQFDSVVSEIRAVLKGTKKEGRMLPPEQLTKKQYELSTLSDRNYVIHIREQYEEHIRNQKGGENVVVNWPEGKNIPSHKELVRQAISEGKAVPPEVLAEYPDLKPTGGKKGEVKETTAPVTPKGKVTQKLKTKAAEIIPNKENLLLQLDKAMLDAPSEKNKTQSEIEKLRESKLHFEIDGGVNVYNTREALQEVRNKIDALPKTESKYKSGSYGLRSKIDATTRTADEIFESIKTKIAENKSKVSIESDIRDLYGTIPTKDYQHLARETDISVFNLKAIINQLQAKYKQSDLAGQGKIKEGGMRGGFLDNTPFGNKDLLQAKIDELLASIGKPKTKTPILSAGDKERKLKDLKRTSKTEAVKVAIEGAGKGLDRAFGLMSTRLKNVSLTLFQEVRNRYINPVKIMVAERTQAAHPFIDNINKKLSDADRYDFEVAQWKGDYATINRINAQYGLEADYEQYRAMLDLVYHEGNTVGMDIDYQTAYFPSAVKDLGGLLKELNNREEYAPIVLAMAEAQKKKGRPLNGDEQVRLIDSLLRGYTVSGLTLSKPGFAKERTLIRDDVSLMKFYYGFEESTSRYIEAMTENIQARKFFGKTTKELVDLRANISRTQTNIAKLEKDISKDQTANIKRAKTKLAKLQVELDAKDDGLLDESVGTYVLDLVTSGIIKYDQQIELQQLFEGIFKTASSSKFVHTLRSLEYLGSLAQVPALVTQYSEIVLSLLKAPMTTLPNFVRVHLGSSKIKLRDIGVAHIGQEWIDADLDKTIVALLKPFEFADRVGKETFINSVVDKYRKLAIKNPDAVKKELAKYYPEEAFDSIINSLKSGVVDDNVKGFALNELADVQPISKMEVPELYSKAGNLRVFYMYKTFVLKRLDIMRREGYNEIKAGIKAGDNKRAAKGIARLLWLAFIFTLADSSADVVKDIIRGKPIQSLDNYIVDNLLQMILLSKYSMSKMPKEGISSFFKDNITMPVSNIDSAARDLWQMFDEDSEKGMETIKRVPWIGDLYYWYMGEGARKIDEGVYDKE